MKVYNKGSDEFYYREIEYQKFGKFCPSIKNNLYKPPENASMVTLGQMQHIMEKGWTGWWSNYFLEQ